MTPLTLDELRELAPGYVMGTLTLEEQRAFDIAMSDASMSSAIAPELAAHRAALDFLASAHKVQPPASLKGRVLSRIASETGGTMSETSDFVAIPSPGPVMRPTVSTTAIPERPMRAVTAQPRGSRAGWWSAGALAVAFAASLVFSVDLRKQVTALQAQLTEQVASLGTTQGKLAERERTLATLLGGGGDLTLVRLSPNQPSGPGMQVFWNVKEGRAIVTASGLAPVKSDRAYALWMIRDGKPVPLALFNPDAGGRAVVQDIVVPTDMAGVAAFAVTEEPAAGSAQPTTTPFLVGTVPK